MSMQMLSAIDAEVRRQIQPFLSAGIQPDIILLENEGSSGMLYDVELPNGEKHSRGVADNAQVSKEQLRKEVCGQNPTGHAFV